MSVLVHVSLVDRGRTESGAGTESGAVPKFGSGSGYEVRDSHLRVSLDDAADRNLREHADVLYFTRAVSAEEVAAQLAVYPGCLVCAGAAADGGILIAVRGAGQVEICPLMASTVHALLASGVYLGHRSGPYSEDTA